MNREKRLKIHLSLIVLILFSVCSSLYLENEPLKYNLEYDEDGYKVVKGQDNYFISVEDYYLKSAGQKMEIIN